MAVIRQNRVDYLGLNFYARVMVKPYERQGDNLIVNNQERRQGTSQTIIKGWFEQVRPESSRYTEWDTEIFPEGLYEGYDRYGINTICPSISRKMVSDSMRTHQ